MYKHKTTACLIDGQLSLRSHERPRCPLERNIIKPNPTQPNKSARWLCIFIVVIAIAYGIVDFFSVMAIWKKAYRVTGVVAPLGIGVGGATILLTGFWSVMGTGKYYQRLLVSHLISQIVAMAVIAGTVCYFWQWDGASRVLVHFMYVIYWIPSFSLAAQLPLWFFRGVLSWRLVPRDEEPGLAISLRDVFLMTFVCALAFATPRMLVRHTTASANSIYEGLTEPTIRSAAVEQPDGSFAFKDVLVTEENIDQIRAVSLKRVTNEIHRNLRISMLTILIGSALMIPIVFYVFDAGKSGYIFGFLYAIVLAVVTIWIATRGSLGGPPMAIGIFSSIGATILPLLVLRRFGFVLCSRKLLTRDLAANTARQ